MIDITRFGFFSDDVIVLPLEFNGRDVGVTSGEGSATPGDRVVGVVRVESGVLGLYVEVAREVQRGQVLQR